MMHFRRGTSALHPGRSRGRTDRVNRSRMDRRNWDSLLSVRSMPDGKEKPTSGPIAIGIYRREIWHPAALLKAKVALEACFLEEVDDLAELVRYQPRSCFASRT